MPARRTSTQVPEAGAQVSASKHEAAYELIRTRIVDGTYGPGYRLVLEQLAREFGFSSVPIREAIRRLEAEGYVEFIRNVGARVAHFETDMYQQAMQALALLEGYATALAAAHMRKSDIAKAKSINRRMTEALDAFDPATFTDLNHQFHDVIIGRCPNAYIRGLAAGEWARLDLARRTSFAFVPGRAKGSVAEHQQIIELLESGADERKIEMAARKHKLATLAAIMDRKVPGPKRAAAR